jgi:hypothetical protein
MNSYEKKIRKREIEEESLEVKYTARGAFVPPMD